MLNAQEQRNEVARLLFEIRNEHENIKEIFTMLGDDPCKYHFIVGKLDNMYTLRRQLQDLVGDTANEMIGKELETCPDGKKEHEVSVSGSTSEGREDDTSEQSSMM